MAAHSRRGMAGRNRFYDVSVHGGIVFHGRGATDFGKARHPVGVAVGRRRRFGYSPADRAARRGGKVGSAFIRAGACGSRRREAEAFVEAGGGAVAIELYNSDSDV